MQTQCILFPSFLFLQDPFAFEVFSLLPPVFLPTFYSFLTGKPLLINHKIPPLDSFSRSAVCLFQSHLPGFTVKRLLPFFYRPPKPFFLGKADPPSSLYNGALPIFAPIKFDRLLLFFLTSPGTYLSEEQFERCDSTTLSSKTPFPSLFPTIRDLPQFTPRSSIAPFSAGLLFRTTSHCLTLLPSFFCWRSMIGAQEWKLFASTLRFLLTSFFNPLPLTVFGRRNVVKRTR